MCFASLLKCFSVFRVQCVLLRDSVKVPFCTDMPLMQIRVPEEDYVMSMNQKKLFQAMPRTGDNFEDVKDSIGRKKGRRRCRGAKVERLQDSTLDLNSNSSCKSLKFQSRPGYGQLGTKCIVKANHFLTEITGSDLSHYSVSLASVSTVLKYLYQGLIADVELLWHCFLAQVKITPEVHSVKLSKAIMTQLVKNHRNSDLGMKLPVYDGGSTLYTAGMLPFTSKEFTIALVDQQTGTGYIR